MSGHVKDYNPPADGKEESWILRYENPRKEESDDNSDDDEEVNRAELDKLFNLQGVRDREFPPKVHRCIHTQKHDPSFLLKACVYIQALSEVTPRDGTVRIVQLFT